MISTSGQIRRFMKKQSALTDKEKEHPQALKIATTKYEPNIPISQQEITQYEIYESFFIPKGTKGIIKRMYVIIIPTTYNKTDRNAHSYNNKT